MRRRPRTVTSTRMVPWQPASTPASDGSSRMAKSASEQLRPLRHHLRQAVVYRRHLFAGIRHEGHITTGRGHLRGGAEQHRKPALHVHRPQPVHALFFRHRDAVWADDGHRLAGATSETTPLPAAAGTVSR